MHNDLLAELSWLPRPPADFDARIRALSASPQVDAVGVRALAAYGLSDGQLTRIARALGKARAGGQSSAPLIPYRLGVITNSTTEFMCSAIAGTGPRFGFDIECITGGYDQGLQESLNPGSPINAAKPNAVLLAIDWRGLPLRSKAGSAVDTAGTVNAARQYLNAIRTGIHQHSGAVCIVQNLAGPAERVFGSLDRAIPGSFVDVIRAVNEGIAEDLRDSGDVLFDVAGLAETVGLANWHSPAEWNLAKLPFASAFLALYADHLCRLIASMNGRSRRCLVLDLDNTLWGGVIGDDGLAGIQLAQGDTVGEAFVDFQRYILALRDRGIVLAVSSKNTDAVARAPFREHPDMLIREEHIAVFQANWNDKPTNITAIARELSLGLESMVFADDNPFERELVRTTLPDVAVVEMPTDPALYARTLSAAGHFELTRLSSEDLSRASFYGDNAKRAELQKQVGNLNDYLDSLQMEIIFQPFDDMGRARIAQLINKSNQFNLTTRRYSESDVAAMENDPSCFTLQVRLLDRFGDNGMISVVICRAVGATQWDIDTWLMSCRVLGRRVEHMVLREILAHASARGVTELVGTFVPSKRNDLVAEHYATLGFELVSRGEAGESTWRLAVDGAEVESPPMVVHRPGLQAVAAVAT